MINASQKLLNRRRLLKGMVGGAAVTVGLPFLNCFLGSSGRVLAATGQELPVVYSTWYWGLGFNPGRWEPKSVGALAELAPETEALERFKNKINLYSGMKVHLDGRPAITHYTGNMSVLTGTTPAAQVATTSSIDTLISEHIGSSTRFSSLEMTSTGNPKHMYSFRRGGVFQSAEASPAAMYARLFGPEFTDPNAAEFRPDPKVMARQSVLSAVKEQHKSLERLLGTEDRARLDEYFTSLRELEQRLELQLQRPAPLAACTVPPQLPAEMPVGTEIEVVAANHRLLAQLAAHAFACNQTHVVNLTYSDMTSSLRRAGSQMIHHIYTHEEAIDEKLGYQPHATYFIDRSMEAFVEYLAALDSIKEGDRTLLDRALVFAVTDTGYAKVHSLENMPMITAGAAGGRMRTGLHVSCKGDPATRLGLTIQQALGMPVNSWGTDSMTTTKTITEVLT